MIEKQKKQCDLDPNFIPQVKHQSTQVAEAKALAALTVLSDAGMKK
jgi:hypothetical protein